MTMIFGIPIQAFLGQLLVGLINGSFYALLSLGLAVIFGLLRVINFAHGAQYMLGAFVALLGLKWLGIPYWAALVVAPYALGQRERGTVLSSPVMRTLGRWSYSVFLWHMAVLYFVFPVLGVDMFSGHFVVVYAATALASTAVAYVSYELVEVPGARLVRQATANRPATTKKVEEPA